jgi:hypothetical protein
MWDRVKNPGSRRITSSFIRSHTMKGNGTEGKTFQRGKNPNNSKVQGSSPKEILLRKGLILKQANLRGMLVGSPKEHASCRNPSLGFVTKARGCKFAGQEGDPRITSHAPESAKSVRE